MRYFQFFSQVPYSFTGPQLTITDAAHTYTTTITNITQRAVLRDRLLAHTSAFYDYVIPGEQRPDSVALTLYGTVAYTWIVLLLNDIYSLFDWPLSNQELHDYLVIKYGSYERATQPTDTLYYFDRNHTPMSAGAYAALDVHERGEVLPAKYFYDVTGVPVDALTYTLLPTTQQGIIETAHDYEVRLNEQKRKIKVLRPQFLPNAEAQLKTLFLRS